MKCVLDVFTDVRNLQSVMAMEKRTGMGSIKIRIQEFRSIPVVVEAAKQAVNITGISTVVK